MLKKLNYWTIGFFERHLLEPLIKVMIIGFIIFLIITLNGCTQEDPFEEGELCMNSSLFIQHANTNWMIGCNQGCENTFYKLSSELKEDSEYNIKFIDCNEICNR